MNRSVLAAVNASAATLIASPATAYADRGDPNQPPCKRPLPTPHQVVPAMAELTDPAPNNLAGATVTNPPVWRQQHSGSGPVVLAYQNGHWMITEHTAYARVYQFLVDCMKAGGPHGI
jgi:hypothetical protein